MDDRKDGKEAIRKRMRLFFIIMADKIMVDKIYSKKSINKRLNVSVELPMSYSLSLIDILIYIDLFWFFMMNKHSLDCHFKGKTFKS